MAAKITWKLQLYTEAYYKHILLAIATLSDKYKWWLYRLSACKRELCDQKCHSSMGASI